MSWWKRHDMCFQTVTESTVICSLSMFSTVAGAAKRLNIADVARTAFSDRYNMIRGQDNFRFFTLTAQAGVIALCLQISPFLGRKRAAISQFACTSALSFCRNFIRIGSFPLSRCLPILFRLCSYTSAYRLTGLLCAPVRLYPVCVFQSRTAIRFFSSIWMGLTVVLLNYASFITIVSLPETGLFDSLLWICSIARTRVLIATGFAPCTQSVTCFFIKFGHRFNLPALCTLFGFQDNLSKSNEPHLCRSPYLSRVQKTHHRQGSLRVNEIQSFFDLT